MLAFDPKTTGDKPSWLTVPEHDETIRPKGAPMTQAEQRRMAPILGHIAAGDLPLDTETKRNVKRYLDAVHRQAIHGGGPDV
jgi:hypothetical protein